MTSEALITAVTSLPSARPSSRAASTVIEATSRTPAASSSTLAMASPLLMLVTRAGIWFRALRRMAVLPQVIDGVPGQAIRAGWSRHDGHGPAVGLHQPDRQRAHGPVPGLGGGSHDHRVGADLVGDPAQFGVRVAVH